MIVVRFKTGVSPYQCGEIAGFAEAEAEQLIKAGVAEVYSENLEASSSTPEAAADAATTGTNGPSEGVPENATASTQSVDEGDEGSGSHDEVLAEQSGSEGSRKTRRR